ncbi:TFIIA-alpha and beta like factor isoform 3-like protein [Camelus ferus]|nr:TFIIA-alpha and beta like factor isoform 3-like protein [Camelus ferus]
MDCVNPVPKLYSSVIEDVIEGVRDLFAEEGVEEQVLKDLKQGTSNSSANFAFPGYPIHVPAGVTLQTASVERKRVENTTSDILVHPGNEHKLMSEALPSQLKSSQYISLPGVVFSPQVSQTDSHVEPVLSVFAGMTQNLHGGPLSTGPQGTQHQHMPDVQLHILKNRLCGCDSVKQPRDAEEPSSLPVSEKDSNSQMDLSIQVADDGINEIIQIDGTGDTSSNDEIGSTKDVDENEFLGIIDAGDLKVLEEEADSISSGDSTADSSDNEDPQIDLVEEDPLNSGDDVSEQDVPDLFDTDNVIVCQYDKIHRSKNKWKFYLKDGVMCFGGRDYVFAKAIGDAEW